MLVVATVTLFGTVVGLIVLTATDEYDAFDAMKDYALSQKGASRG